ncbi:MAG: hypothetical protein Q8P90_03610 [bacterium]|nr:hypothetical protein [bacterium]
MRAFTAVICTLLISVTLFVLIPLSALRFTALNKNFYINTFTEINAYQKSITIIDKNYSVNTGNDIIQISDFVTANWLQSTSEQIIIAVFDVINTPNTTIQDIDTTISLATPKQNLEDKMSSSFDDAIKNAENYDTLEGDLENLPLNNEGDIVDIKDITEKIPEKINLNYLIANLVNGNDLESLVLGTKDNENNDNVYAEDNVEILNLQLSAIQQTVKTAKIAVIAIFTFLLFLITVTIFLYKIGSSKLLGVGWAVIIPGFIETVLGIILIFSNTFFIELFQIENILPSDWGLLGVDITTVLLEKIGLFITITSLTSFLIGAVLIILGYIYKKKSTSKF